MLRGNATSARPRGVFRRSGLPVRRSEYAPFLMARVLCAKPVPTFAEHALSIRRPCLRCATSRRSDQPHMQAPEAAASTASRPAYRDDRDRPSCGAGHEHHKRGFQTGDNSGPDLMLMNGSASRHPEVRAFCAQPHVHLAAVRASKDGPSPFEGRAELRGHLRVTEKTLHARHSRA